MPSFIRPTFKIAMEEFSSWRPCSGCFLSFTGREQLQQILDDGIGVALTGQSASFATCLTFPASHPESAEKIGLPAGANFCYGQSTIAHTVASRINRRCACRSKPEILSSRSRRRHAWSRSDIAKAPRPKSRYWRSSISSRPRLPSAY